MRSLLKNEAFLISVTISLHLLFLLYGLQNLSISYGEALIYFKEHSMTHYIVRISTAIFGQNDFGLRFPFILLHILSVILLYKISKTYLKRKSDRVFAVVVYLLLPGTNSAALLVNPAEFVIFLTLLFIYTYHIFKFSEAKFKDVMITDYGLRITEGLKYLYRNRSYYISYAVLFLALFVDNSFSILYLSLLFYALYKKDNRLLVVSLLLFGLSMYIWGFDTGGKPKNYFVETLALYSAIFSPLVFLYFFYTEYRILIKEKKNILWFISFVAFLFSLLLSFRQKVMLEDFAPFAIIATPLMIRTFLSSYRVRIPELRFWHRLIFLVVMTTLVLNFTAIYFNKFFYLILSNPQKHFTYRYDFAKEVAVRLKELGIYRINVPDKRFALRLKFYGIKSGGKYLLSKNSKNVLQNVTISYYKKPVFTLCVTK